MKQIVIRSIAPGLPVFDFSYGEITDGQFHSFDVSDLSIDLLPFIQISNLLGTQAYICGSNLRDFFACAIPYVSDIAYYDRFIVLSLNPDYGTEKEEE